MAGEGVRNRRRGFQFERDVVNMAKEKGLDAKRMWGSDGKSAGLPSEVDIVLEGSYYQCKRKKRIAGDIQPSEGIDGQIIKADRSEPLIVLRLKKYLEMLKGEKDV